jgi:hypothetical protein
MQFAAFVLHVAHLLAGHVKACERGGEPLLDWGMLPSSTRRPTRTA